MSEGPRGKRLQVHLSTAVVMMIAAGGIIWANVSEKQNNQETWYLLSPVREPYWRVVFYGWPLYAMRSTTRLWVNKVSSLPEDSSGRDWVAAAVVIDALTALAILFAVWFVCEWWIRRRAARKGT